MIDKNDCILLGFIDDGIVLILSIGNYDEDKDCTGFEYQLYLSDKYVKIFKYKISYGKPYIPYEGDGCCVFNGMVKNKLELKRILQQVGCIKNKQKKQLK